MMNNQWISRLVLPLALAAGTFSCASTSTQFGASSASSQTHWQRLRTGMSYSQVSSVLRPVDPGIAESIKDAMEQEREARKDRQEVLAELRRAGVGADPELRSEIRIDGGDYILVFRDGKLSSWNLK